MQLSVNKLRDEIFNLDSVDFVIHSSFIWNFTRIESFCFN